MTTQVFLKDLFSSTVSGYWGSEAAASEVDVKIVRNGDIARDGSVRWGELPVRGLSEAEVKKASISGDDLLMTTSGECGRVALVRSDPVGVCTSNFVRRIRCDTTRTDPGFAYYLLRDRTIQREFERFTRGTTLQNLSLQKAFSSISVSLPPLEEQKRIASILDAADQLRTKRQQAIDQLDTLTQAIFIGMFGDPNKNPRGLTKQALVELVKFKSGEGLTSKAMRPGDYSVYGGNGINGTHDAYRFEQPQVVVGRVGVYCGCVHLSEPKSWITDNALYVARMSDNLTRTYLAAALRQANLNQYANQAAQPLISGARVYPVEILVPPKTEQLMFEEAIEVQAAVKVSIGSSERALDSLFASLQQRAFRGDL